LGAFVQPATFDRWRAFSLTMLCADMVGAMQAALNMGLEHARSRHQFGHPIGSFQAIQHLCAEQHVSLEASRSATYYSAWAVDGLGPDEALVAARVAKAYVSRVSTQVVEAVMQIYGGLGQSWECTAHLFLRRVLADRIVLGDDRIQEVALAPCIGGDARQMSDSA
jgi:alkylation response protein AidB-like acyl-CoA dehydrogenase